MDEVYTCCCGGQKWIIRNGAITCSKCNRWYYLLGLQETPKSFNETRRKHKHSQNPSPEAGVIAKKPKEKK